ncbi:hypothetical protein GCM10020216_106570 [Nonomuraea helvata]
MRQRLRSLTWLELLNITLQAVICFGVVGFPVTAANGVGFALFALVLLEGAGYWYAKLRRLATRRGSLPRAGAFAVARRTNVAVLTVGLLFICLDRGDRSASRQLARSGVRVLRCAGACELVVG